MCKCKNRKQVEKHITFVINIVEQVQLWMRILVWKCRECTSVEQNHFVFHQNLKNMELSMTVLVRKCKKRNLKNAVLHKCKKEQFWWNSKCFCCFQRYPRTPGGPVIFVDSRFCSMCVCIFCRFWCIFCHFPSFSFGSIVVYLKLGSRLTFWWTYAFSYCFHLKYRCVP